MQKWPLNHTCTVAICSLDATKNQSGIYYLEVIWLDCTLVLYFHSPAARENMAAYSCNIHPYYLLTHQILLVRWLSLGRGGGEPERTCMHCWCFVMAADNSRIFSNELVNKTSYSHFLVTEATTATHMLGLHVNFTMKSWAESSELMSVIMHGPYLKQTQLLCVIWRYRLWAACSCLSWSTVAFSRSIVGELDSKGSIVSLSLRTLEL